VIKRESKGFSLVELVIVLVVIGLIVAGIAAGSNILYAAKLNKVITELRNYEIAFDKFRIKYNYWPGDMQNATSYWGVYNSSTNEKGVTNGDGSETYNSYQERYQAWSHLAKSGMIIGDYNGYGGSYIQQFPLINVPESGALKNAIYFADFAHDIYNTAGFFIQLKDGSLTDGYWDGNMNSEDVYYIDRKIDDGQSGIASATSGDIYAVRSESLSSNNDKCVSAYQSADDADYVLNDSGKNCRLVLWLEKR